MVVHNAILAAAYICAKVILTVVLQSKENSALDKLAEAFDGGIGILTISLAISLVC